MPGVAYSVSNLGSTIPQPKGNADPMVAAVGSKGVPGHLLKVYLPMLRSAAETGRIPDYHDGPCSGGATPSGGIGVGTQLGLATAQAGLQAGIAAIKIGTTALNAIPVVGQILSSAIILITLPFQHHQQAVHNEQATLCQAVPDAQNFLAQVYQYVQSGQCDYVTAVQQMEVGFTAWRSVIAGIITETGNRCDEACFYERFFRAAIEKTKLDYQQPESNLSQDSSKATKSMESSVAEPSKSISEL